MAEVPSKSYFERISSKTGFLVSNLEKVYRLIRILKEIDSFDHEGYLALRGGTALNFCFQSISRLSIDIDLVYVKSFEKTAMKKDRIIISESLDRVFRFLQYEIDNRTTYALDQYLLTYQNVAGNPDRIKVEINYVSSRVPILKVTRRKIDTPFDTDQFDVAVLDQEELYGSKIKALIERGKARDLFDVYHFVKKNKTIDFKTLRRAVIFYSCLELNSDFWLKVNDGLFDDMDENDIKRELKPLLSKDYIFHLDEAKRAVKNLIDDIIRLKEEEKRFVTLFYKQDYRPELLFPINLELKNHPGAKWRLKILANKGKS